METDDESSEESSSEADTPLNGNLSVTVGPPDMMLLDQEAMDTAPDNLDAGETRPTISSGRLSFRIRS